MINIVFLAASPDRRFRAKKSDIINAWPLERMKEFIKK